jgi:hypothetical protein
MGLNMVTHPNVNRPNSPGASYQTFFLTLRASYNYNTLSNCFLGHKEMVGSMAVLRLPLQHGNTIKFIPVQNVEMGGLWLQYRCNNHW